MLFIIILVFCNHSFIALAQVQGPMGEKFFFPHDAARAAIKKARHNLYVITDNDWILQDVLQYNPNIKANIIIHIDLAMKSDLPKPLLRRGAKIWVSENHIAQHTVVVADEEYVGDVDSCMFFEDRDRARSAIWAWERLKKSPDTHIGIAPSISSSN